MNNKFLIAIALMFTLALGFGNNSHAVSGNDISPELQAWLTTCNETHPDRKYGPSSCSAAVNACIHVDHYTAVTCAQNKFDGKPTMQPRTRQ